MFVHLDKSSIRIQQRGKALQSRCRILNSSNNETKCHELES